MMSISSIQSTIERHRKETDGLSTKIADQRKRKAEAETTASEAAAEIANQLVEISNYSNSNE